DVFRELPDLPLTVHPRVGRVRFQSADRMINTVKFKFGIDEFVLAGNRDRLVLSLIEIDSLIIVQCAGGAFPLECENPFGPPAAFARPKKPATGSWSPDRYGLRTRRRSKADSNSRSHLTGPCQIRDGSPFVMLGVSALERARKPPRASE